MLPCAENAPSMLSPTRYTSEAAYKQEMSDIFGKSWLFAGLATDLEDDHGWTRLPLGGAGILVGRFGGKLHAAANLCAHRGTPLVAGDHQLGSELRCPYHGWRYSPDGRLIQAPGIDMMPSCSLAVAAIQTWNSLVFVSPWMSAPPLASAWQGFDRQVVDVAWDSLRAHRTTRYTVRANWKIVVENYLEDVHFPTVHPELDALTPGGTAELIAAAGTWLGGSMQLHPPTETVSTNGRRVGRLIGPSGLVRDYLLWPNLLLSVHPDYVATDVVWPVSPDRCEVVSTWYFHEADVEDSSFDPFSVYAFWDVANPQDWQICELQQAGLASFGARPGRYTPNDVLVRAFDDRVRALTPPRGRHPHG